MLRLITTYCLLLIFSLPLGAQETARLKNIRVWAAPDNTRVVFDLSGPIRHELKLLSGPYRVVIDLENTAPIARFSYPALRDGHVQEMRHGQHDDFLRIVLDLEQRVKAKSFLLKPNKHYGHRLVVDVTDEQQQQQQQQPVIKKRAPATGYRDIVVAVDAGHGGEDPGAIGPHGTYEKTVVLQIARELVKRINKERGMKAALTRTGDYYVPLRKRMELARRQHADLFISIHADAFTNRQVRGSSVYILSSRGASSEHARWLAARENASDLMGGVSLDDKDNQLASVLLDMSQTASEEASIEAAEKVLAGLKEVGKVHKPAVEYAAFAVLKSPDIPSMLIETAFISNPQEEKKLRSSAYQRKLAQAIATGIKRYFQLNPPENTLLAARGTTN